MRFNPQNVIILLSAVFNALDFPENPITSEELIMEEKLEDMLKEIYEDWCEIEEEEIIKFLKFIWHTRSRRNRTCRWRKNYTCHIKKMLCDVDDISRE